MAHRTGHTSPYGYNTLSGRNPNSGRGTPAGWSSAAAYGKAYGAQRNLGGYRSLDVPYKGTKKQTFRFPLGGFGGRRGGGARFAEEDLKRQLEYDKAVWDRSTPDVSGVGYNVRWDRDKNMVTSTLSEENQAIYDAMFERQKGFAEDVEAYGGDWRDIQQESITDKLALYADSDAREEAIRKARQVNTGASTTGIFTEDYNKDYLRNQSNLALAEAAFSESQGLIDSALNRQTRHISSMMNLANVANQGIVTPTPFPQGNMANVSLASTRWADNLAMEAAKKAQGKSQFWNSLLGGQSGGMFGGAGGGGGGINLSYIATSTTQALGEDGLRVFEDWRDYMFYALPTFATSFGRYRATAPKIVEEINKKDNPKALYKEIWDDYLKPIFNLIKKDKDDPKALSDYKIMVRELQNRYLRR